MSGDPTYRIFDELSSYRFSVTQPGRLAFFLKTFVSNRYDLPRRQEFLYIRAKLGNVTGRRLNLKKIQRHFSLDLISGGKGWPCTW
jgi:hypothetical protein